jgi:hypothetical protein
MSRPTARCSPGPRATTKDQQGDPQRFDRQEERLEASPRVEVTVQGDGVDREEGAGQVGVDREEGAGQVGVDCEEGASEEGAGQEGAGQEGAGQEGDDRQEVCDEVHLVALELEEPLT